MDGISFGLTISFTAGLLSFLSPCVLPLIPSYVTFITGMSLEDAQHAQTARRAALVHSLLFIAGFSAIFILLGATATAVGRVLLAYEEWITRIGGALIIVFGLYMLGAFNVTFLAAERRIHLANKPVGYLGTVLVGIAFGAGWTPCLGPILGSILTLTATSSGDVGTGMLHLSVYSLGLAVPFLLSALMLRHFMAFFTRFRTKMVWVTRIAGGLMVLIGVLLLTDQFTRLATYLSALTPEFLRSRL
jgi:cytochrome c-type biogenesis protein